MNREVIGQNAHEYRISGHTLINYPTAEFNAELVRQTWRHLLAVVKDSFESKWCLVEVLTKTDPITPDGLVALTEQFNKAREMGCKKVLIVTPYAIFSEFYISETCRAAGLSYAICESEESACSEAEALLSNKAC